MNFSSGNRLRLSKRIDHRVIYNASNACRYAEIVVDSESNVDKSLPNGAEIPVSRCICELYSGMALAIWSVLGLTLYNVEPRGIGEKREIETFGCGSSSASRRCCVIDVGVGGNNRVYVRHE